MSPEDLLAVRCLVQQSECVVWLTGGNLLQAPRPDFALASALFRTLRLEHFPVKIAVLDTDKETSSKNRLSSAALMVMEDMLSAAKADEEYILTSGTMHVSRILSNEFWTSQYRTARNRELDIIKRSRLGDASLSIGSVGDLDSTYMQRRKQISKEGIGAADVEIEVGAVGLNAKVVFDPTCSDLCNNNYAGYARIKLKGIYTELFMLLRMYGDSHSRW